jgi:hypothetical protein
MIVTPTIGKSRLIARVDGVLGIFDDKFEQPQVGQPVEVMISGVCYNRCDDGYVDPDSVRFVFLRVVTPDLVEISHDGFECSGTMCRTLAHAKYDNRTIYLTPGRTGVWVADNVNVGWKTLSGTIERQELRPGVCYVEAARINKGGAVRVEGVGSINELDFRVRAAEKAAAEVVPAPKANAQNLEAESR